MLVEHRFILSKETKSHIKGLRAAFGFGLLSEVVFYRSYSRLKENGSNESWNDVVIRVTEGVLSIKKNFHIRHGLGWDEKYWQNFAKEFALSMFRLKWLPPGRGLWMMGTKYVYKRGSAALYNCAAVDTSDLALAADWAMDMLMVGAGVGFNTAWDGKAAKPDKKHYRIYKIEDSKEGWTKSVRLLIQSYTSGGPFYRFDYSAIRPAGSPIKGFGGVAAGPEPLRKLHEAIERILDDYCDNKIDKTRTVVDIFNHIGVCVVSGNIRRSAEIAIGDPDDKTFLDLKDYDKYPERAAIGWVSNNSVLLKDLEDFRYLDEIARRIYKNGEPGILHVYNMQHFGRFGQPMEDRAWLSNPCGEIALESFELCNLAEVFIPKCENRREFLKMLEFATLYASTVNLLPTHRPCTNEVVARNRRIGVSVGGVADAVEKDGLENVIAWLRDGYEKVRQTNAHLARQTGIPVSIKVSAVKPSGTISLLAGTSPGMHYPPFTYALRRIRIGAATPLARLLISYKIPYEKDLNDPNTLVFEFPIHYPNPKDIQSVDVWEQMSLLTMLQREWADNMVSNTIEFDKKRYTPDDIARILKYFLPMIKSTTLIPKNEEIFPQMPIVGISKEEYEERIAHLPKIDWTKLGGHHPQGERFCSARSCKID